MCLILYTYLHNPKILYLIITFIKNNAIVMVFLIASFLNYVLMETLKYFAELSLYSSEYPVLSL